MSHILDKLMNANLFFDGAMGTMLEASGVSGRDIPDIYNITNRDLIINIHKEYINSGCDIITTNTFGSNRYKLAEFDYSTKDVVKAAITCAIEAIRESGLAGKVSVACDIGPSGKLIYPLGNVTFDDVYDSYKEIVLTAVECGADLFIIETMSDIYEAKAAILACKENSNLPVFATMTIENNDRTLTGSTVDIIGITLENLGVNAIGFNCSRGPETMHDVVEKLSNTVNIPIMIQPNAGLPINKDGKVYYPLGALEFAKAVKELAMPNVRIFGGCCGTTPQHIKELINIVTKENIMKYGEDRLNNNDYVTSASVIKDLNNSEISNDIIITSDIDVNDVIDEIYELIDDGVDIISLNLLDDSKFDKNLMCNILNDIQSIIRLPIVFKSESKELLNYAERYYNGKSKFYLVYNSVENK